MDVTLAALPAAESRSGYKSFVRPLNLTNFEDSNPHAALTTQFSGFTALGPQPAAQEAPPSKCANK